MKFLLRAILIAVLAYLTAHFLPLPWWSVAIIAFLVGLTFGNKPVKRRTLGKIKKHRPFSFWSGFVAAFFLWGWFALRADLDNASYLSNQIYQILPLQFVPESMAATALIFITALVGGIVGGLASLTGNALGEAVK